MGVGPFKKEGKRLKPQRGDFPSYPPEGARALRGLKDRIWSVFGGRQGVFVEVRVPRISGVPRASGSVLGKRSSRCYLALPPAPALQGLGRGQRKSEDLGSRGGGGERPHPDAGREREREEAVKGTEAEAIGSPRNPTPASTPGQASPPSPRPDPRVQLQTFGVQGLTFLLLLSSLLFWKG